MLVACVGMLHIAFIDVNVSVDVVLHWSVVLN